MVLELMRLARADAGRGNAVAARRPRAGARALSRASEMPDEEALRRDFPG
jgi:hypothetical protein